MPRNYEALLLDLSGVLYDGTRVIDGAVAFMERARASGLVLRFVTNTATKSAATIRADLQRMGIDIAPDELFTAPLAAKSYIEAKGLRPYCLIHPEIEPDFAGLPRDDPNCVLLGDARDGLNYASLNKAFRLCQQGAPLIAIGLNKYFMDDEGLMLDAGPFVRALEWAIGTEAIIMGKPSAAFYEQVVASTGIPAEHCLMVGDDVCADVAAALDAGLQAVLVRTGKYQAGDDSKVPPSGQIIDSVDALLRDPPGSVQQP